MIEMRKATAADAEGEVSTLLAEGLKHDAMLAKDEDGVICFWGFLPESLLGSQVYMWFYPVRELTRYRTRFLRANRRYIRQILDRYPVIVGSVDLSDSCARRWLSWLGFAETETFEYEGKAYSRIELRAK